ncbi:MAG TPA: hypothetical protein DCO77_00415 [Nitrospiraceae bacterium]|nr:hypothetical protein [Nitrospiraceae bacterium]
MPIERDGQPGRPASRRWSGPCWSADPCGSASESRVTAASIAVLPPSRNPKRTRGCHACRYGVPVRWLGRRRLDGRIKQAKRDAHQKIGYADLIGCPLSKPAEFPVYLTGSVTLRRQERFGRTMALRTKDALPRGHQFEGYRIEGVLGTGAFGITYRAREIELGRWVAIKEYFPRELVGRAKNRTTVRASHRDESETYKFSIDCFRDEAKVLVNFDHPNIISVYRYFMANGTGYLVMPFTKGETLQDRLDRDRTLPEDDITRLVLPLLDGLEQVHEAGFLHRDIKPSNIMIKRNGEVKLMDFGIAHTKKLQTLTQPGTFLGTPAYMSPEQILGLPLDAQSDIFSFGIVLYEMFTGTKPFLDEETRSVSAKILKDRFRTPRSLNTRVPRRVQRIIKKCLRKKPSRRYNSMQELARALGRSIAGKTNKSVSLKRISDHLVEANVFEAPPESETVMITNVPGRGLFKNLLSAAVVLLVLAAAWAGYYYWSTTQ